MDYYSDDWKIIQAADGSTLGIDNHIRFYRIFNSDCSFYESVGGNVKKRGVSAPKYVIHKLYYLLWIVVILFQNIPLYELSSNSTTESYAFDTSSPP